jgi:hypothetical protein
MTPLKMNCEQANKIVGLGALFAKPSYIWLMEKEMFFFVGP